MKRFFIFFPFWMFAHASVFYSVERFVFTRTIKSTALVNECGWEEATSISQTPKLSIPSEESALCVSSLSGTSFPKKPAWSKREQRKTLYNFPQTSNVRVLLRSIFNSVPLWLVQGGTFILWCDARYSPIFHLVFSPFRSVANSSLPFPLSSSVSFFSMR